MAGTFSKKTSGGNLPPAGAISFYFANNPAFLVDDSTHTTYVAANAAETALLRNHVGIWLKET